MFGGDDLSKERVVNILTDELDRKAKTFFQCNLNLLRAIAEDETLSKWFQGYTVYELYPGYEGLVKILDKEFFHKAYEEGLVIPKYREIIEQAGLDNNLVINPTSEWVATLTKQQILACVAYHFRADHFDNGRLYRYSVGEGKLIPYFEEYLCKS